MTKDDVLLIAEEFSKWLNEMSEKFNEDTDDIQAIVKHFLE